MLSTLQGKEKETLYIIGNGFDLYHGVKSKYKHFYCLVLEIEEIKELFEVKEHLTEYIEEYILEDFKTFYNIPENKYELEFLSIISGFNLIPLVAETFRK